MRPLASLLAILLAAALPGCSTMGPLDRGAPTSHTHTAPHGGTLLELGEHAYTLEFVRDTAAGTLTVHVLDGHAEKPIRIAAASIALIAMPGGKFTPVTLNAVANPATGETSGDTSQFTTQADWLKTAGAFSGIVTLEIKGVKFEQVGFGVAP